MKGQVIQVNGGPDPHSYGKRQLTNPLYNPKI